MSIMRRWRFLEDEPAVTNPGWIPPEGDCPELADLRAEHQRLLNGFAEANQALFQLRQQAEADAVKRSDALRAAILAGGDPKTASFPKSKITEAQLAEAVQRTEIARDALQQFVERAVEQIGERSGQIHKGLAERLQDAEAKRTEARALLREAERLSAEPRRMLDWLARSTGESPLGLFPFSDMAVPVPVPVPAMFEEIAGLASTSNEIFEVEDDDTDGIIEVGGDGPTAEELEAMSNA
jgi:hypothetical protein